MASRRQNDAPQSSVTADRLFAPAPHELISDPLISYAAFRLWCVLHRLAWLREPPEIERLALEMKQDARTPDRRSVYRWLVELESRGWLDWHRTPGKANANRFIVRTTRGPAILVSEDDEPVTPESQPVTLRSQVVTVRSQVAPVYPLPEQAREAPYNNKNHIDHGGGDRARARRSISDTPPHHVAYLASKGMIAADEFKNLDPDSAIADFDARRADRFPIGVIVDEWRKHPPVPGDTYADRQRSGPAPDNPRRSEPVAPRGKHAPTGGADLRDPGWMDRELAKLEALAREREL